MFQQLKKYIYTQPIYELYQSNLLYQDLEIKKKDDSSKNQKMLF